jgi:hypothetical protein
MAKGVLVDQMTSTARLAYLAARLRPVVTKFELTRIGSGNDGGYLLPDDFEGVTDCFSPGVSGNASFEVDLLAKKGIGSHLADYSVDGPPSGFVPKSFTKKFIGSYNDEKFMTMNHWMGSHVGSDPLEDLILQMDIEGAEYQSILAISDDWLRRFRIIVIELHDIESWGHPKFFELVESFFEKLLSGFHVVHNHPNNCCGVVDLNGVIAPRVFELSFLRKNRATASAHATSFPHRLDRPNLEDRPDLPLPRGWY